MAPEADSKGPCPRCPHWSLTRPDTRAAPARPGQLQTPSLEGPLLCNEVTFTTYSVLGDFPSPVPASHSGHVKMTSPPSFYPSSSWDITTPGHRPRRQTSDRRGERVPGHISPERVQSCTSRPRARGQQSRCCWPQGTVPGPDENCSQDEKNQEPCGLRAGEADIHPRQNPGTPPHINPVRPSEAGLGTAVGRRHVCARPGATA